MHISCCDIFISFEWLKEQVDRYTLGTIDQNRKHEHELKIPRGTTEPKTYSLTKQKNNKPLSYLNHHTSAT